MKAHVDSGGDACRGDDLAVVDEAAVRVQLAARNDLPQQVVGNVVCCHFKAIEQLSLAEQQRARADRQHEFRVVSRALDPTEQRFIVKLRASANSARYEQYVRRGGNLSSGSEEIRSATRRNGSGP